MSNNSISYTEKPTREKLHWQIEAMRYSGEPAWINLEQLRKRRDNGHGVNPCGEILLDSKGLCNLTTLNVYSFVVDGVLNVNELLEAQRLSARAGYRMATLNLELHKWSNVQQRDRLIGTSFTGWQDMKNAVNLSEEEEIELWIQMREAVHDEVEKYSKQFGYNKPLLCTTIKPEGTLSCLPTVSSGIHYSHSPYYVRRVRINSQDPLVQVCEELGYPIYPEVGQTMDNCTTKVIEFPIKAPEGKTKYDVTAIEQLETYKKTMQYYTDHNTSITVHVRDHEWEQVEQWVWDNWDYIVGVSFLALDDNFYQLLPYEAITEDEYKDRVSKMQEFNPKLLSKYEQQHQEFELDDAECASGACGVR